MIPWKGFNSYRGESPFDGKSILRKARESGISLVLSAEQHLAEGVISSRFFEGLAAGNAIVSDGHPFIRKHLGKNGFYLNLERGDAYVAAQLMEFVLELRQNSLLLKSQQEFAQELFLEKFDLTKQLLKILEPKIEKHQNPTFDALVIGNSEINLQGELRTLGFERIEHSNVTIMDFQDLLSLARSLDLKRFCIFSGNAEVLDGFVTGLLELSQAMKVTNSQFGVIPTVFLSQGGEKFSPVIISHQSSVLLNGLVIDLTLEKSDFVGLAKKVPLIRMQDFSELQQVSKFLDACAFLGDVGLSIRGDSGIRESIRNELSVRYLQAQRDPIEEIRHMQKARRRALGYSLLSSLPFTKPFASIAKWFLRKKS